MKSGLPTPRPYPGEMLNSTLARMMRYYDMPYHCLSKLMGFSSTPFNGALSPEIIKFFHFSLDGNVSVKQLLLKNSVMPLLTMFGAIGPRAVVEQVCTDVDLIYNQKYSFRSLGLKSYLCFCPQCLTEQISRYGENYWLLEWQIPKVQICVAHGYPLVVTSLRNRTASGLHDASQAQKHAEREEVPDVHARLLASTVHYALCQDDFIIHSTEDWWELFGKLAVERGYRVERPQGAQWYKIEGLSNLAVRYWGVMWLFYHFRSLLLSELRRTKSSLWLQNLIVLKSVAPELDFHEALMEMRNCQK